MSSWQPLILGEALHKLVDRRGVTPKKMKGDWSESGVQVISAKLIVDGRLDLTREQRFVPQDVYERWMIEPLEDGDVLLTSEAPLGEAAMVRTTAPLCLGQRLFALRPNDEVLDPGFLYFWLRSPHGRSALAERSSGTTVLGIRQAELLKVEVPAPPIEIQRAIGRVLGAIDDLIENNRRRVEVLEAMAGTIYREWFVQFRYPGHQDDPLVDSPLGRIPVGFESAIAGDLQKRGVLEIGDGYRAKNSEMSPSGDGLPFIRVANVRDGHLAIDGADELPASYVEKLRSKVSSVGDVVISMKGTVGRQAVVEDWHPRMAYSPQVSFWRSLMPSVVSPTYLYQWIRSNDFARQCSAVKGATDMADYVNLTDQRRMQLMVPPERIMTAFTLTCSPVRQLIGRLQAQAAATAALRDLLLPKLVTGRINVSDLDLDALTGAAVA